MHGALLKRILVQAWMATIDIKKEVIDAVCALPESMDKGCRIDV